jgi:hypothetical protein
MIYTPGIGSGLIRKKGDKMLQNQQRRAFTAESIEDVARGRIPVKVGLNPKGIQKPLPRTAQMPAGQIKTTSAQSSVRHVGGFRQSLLRGSQAVKF